MRVLVVGDDTKIPDFVIQGLKQAGFAVDHRTHEKDGAQLARTELYDTAEIDLMLLQRGELSLVKAIVQAHQRDIAVAREMGHGP